MISGSISTAVAGWRRSQPPAPSSAQRLQSVSRIRSRTSSLYDLSGIGHTHDTKQGDQLPPKAVRGIVRAYPTGGFDQLVLGRSQCVEVAEVLAVGSLIRGRVDLEADLV